MVECSIEKLCQISDIDPRLFKVFKAVVDSGGFTAAGPVLGISRSAISLHMGELEGRLGFTLCQRGRSGFVPTDEGEEVYRATLRQNAHIKAFRNELNNLHE